MAITYNVTVTTCSNIYTTTGGGTVFSSNLNASTAFNYFSNTAVVNDAIYFLVASTAFSNLTFNVGTAMAGTGITLVWEYFCGTTSGWRTCHNLTDGTNNFTTTGVVTVKFPLQAKMTLTTVNGISNICAVRCRITALTTITNGGAQSTTTVKRSDGAVRLTGYSDGAPATWLDVYNYLVANAPETGPARVSADVFKFDNCFINIANGSTLRSTGEKVYMGNGSQSSSSLVNMSGLWSGVKVGTNGWASASSYFFCYTSSTNLISNGPTTRVFGGIWEWFNNTVDGILCAASGTYLGMSSGEWRGVYARSSGYFDNAVCDRCITDGGLITAGAVSIYPTNLNIANPGSYIWQMYGVGNTIPGVTYGSPTTAIMNISAAYNATSGSVYNFVNPNPSFGNQTDAVKVSTRLMGNLAVITNCYFYNSTTTLFTDYTTQAQSATADDVPLSGSVGDIYYFKTSNVNTNYQTALNFTITSQANNYVYAYEYWNGSTWIALVSNVSLFDTTNNFQQTGVVYFGAYANWASTTINSSTGFFVRIRITSAGTGSPTVSKIEQRRQAGIGDWKINEQYSYDLKVTNASSSPIQSANIYIKNNLGTVTGTFGSDASGNITQQTLLRQYFYFNTSVSDANYNVGQQAVNPYLVRVRRYGYIFQDLSKTVSGLSSDVAVLQTNANVVASEATALAYTGISINTGTQKITITSNHSIQELYDYCQAWLAQSANIATNEFLTTSNGQSFTLGYDLELNNAILSGSGTIDMPTKTLTFVGTGSTSLVVTDSVGTKVNISVSGYALGSRIQVYNSTDAVQLYNGVPSSGTLAVPITWLSNKSIRVRSSYVSGASAYLPTQSFGILTNNGASFTITQTSDSVYQTNAVDGSTVTELSADYLNVQIDSNDADGETSVQRIYAWFVYILTTSTGISNFYGAFTADDLYNYKIDTSILNLKFQNISAVPLIVSGARLYRSDGTTIFDVGVGPAQHDPSKAYIANSGDLLTFTDFVALK